MYMLKVITLSVGQLQSNCYLVSFSREIRSVSSPDRSSVPTIIIDPGDDADLIIQSLQQHTLEPIAMIATHGHFDHVMAAYELQEAFNIPFYIHPKDRFLLERLSQTASHFLGRNVVALPPTHVEDIQDFKFQSKNLKLKIIETPGHTPGSVSIHFPGGSYRADCLEGTSALQDDGINLSVFVGDLMFAGGGQGRTDFSYCSKKDLEESIVSILRLPSDTAIYPGHGVKSTIEEELKYYHF
jgi:hydroxyacylglutathione hydrolase